MAAGRDLYAENNMAPQASPSGARDLYAENGINPAQANQSSWIPTSPIRDLIGGIATAGQNVHNFLTPQSMNTNYDFNSPDTPGLGIQNPTKGDQFVQGVGQFAPTMALGEVGAVGKGLEGLEGYNAQMLAKYLPKAVPQATYGASQNPDDRLKGAALGALFSAAPPAATDLIDAARPSSLFGGNLSNEQLQNNLDVTRGTNTGLGRVVDSPALNRVYENILPHVIGSGAENTMQQTAGQISSMGNTVMQNLGQGLDQGNFGQQLQAALKKASSDATAAKNANYKQVNDLADESGLMVGRGNIQNVAQQKLAEINESPELKDHVDPGLISTLQKYSTGVDGNTLKSSNILKGKLGDIANDYYTNSQSYEYGIAKSLKDALGSDINNSITFTGTPELKNAYDTAQQKYATEFAPFDDPDIAKFTKQKNPDTDLLLGHFIKTGATDRPVILSKLMDKLSPTANQESSALPLYAYLSKAMDENGQVNPIQMSTLYNKLGLEQKKILTPSPEFKDSIDNYTDLVGKNREAFNLMSNPKTGARNTDLLLKMGQIAGGGAVGGIGGAILGLGGSGIAGRAATHLLTSPAVRENLVKAITKRQKLKLPEPLSYGVTVGANALYNKGN